MTNATVPLLVLRFAALYGFWVVLSGRFQTKYLLIGAICALVVTFLTQDLVHPKNLQKTKSDDASRSFLLSAWRYCCYSLWLMWSVVQSNLEVAYLVLHPKMPIRPGLLRFTTKLRSQMGQIILANSITLTPGTITVDFHDGTYTIHALVPNAAGALVDAKMQSKLEGIFGEREEATTNIRWINPTRKPQE
jgi:multicomponent Na+:H+ antiporter subunit E